MRKRIGLLGGVGYATTIEYYGRIMRKSAAGRSLALGRPSARDAAATCASLPSQEAAARCGFAVVLSFDLGDGP